jgi:hypothetical protein
MKEQPMKKLLTVFAFITILIGGAPFGAQASGKKGIDHKNRTCPKWELTLAEYFPKKQVPIMSKIMYRESRCQPKVVGWNYQKGMGHKDCKDGRYFPHMKCKAVKSWDVGLLQINSSWYTLTTKLCGKSTRTKILMRPECNLKVAAFLAKEENGGLANWSYPSGKGSMD